MAIVEVHSLVFHDLDLLSQSCIFGDHIPHELSKTLSLARLHHYHILNRTLYFG